MASFKLSFTAVLLCVAFSSCRGQGQSGGAGGAGAAAGGGGSGISAVVPGTQDSVQIVAQAALCFDNRPVLNGCLQAMGVNASGGKGGPSMPAPGAPAIMCSPPCFGHVTMMMSCVNSIFGNFATYNPGLMQGVQAVFQMSCGNVNGPAGGPGAGSGGAAGGAGGAGGAAGGAGGAAGGAGGAGGGVGSGAAGGIPNSIGGAAGGGGGAGGAAAGGIPNSIGGAGTGIVGGAGGGAGMGPAGGVAGGIPNSIGGAAAGGGGGAGAGGASGESGTVSSVGGAAGGGGAGNDTAIAGAVGTTSRSNDTNVVPLPPKHNAGSHVAVSNQSQPTSSADGPTFSLKGACSSMLLVISAGAWLMLV